MKTLTLATMPLDERNTGANIATWLEEVVAKFNISIDNIKAVIHDNGSNIVAAMKLLAEKHNWVSVRCTGHTLQLIVNSSLKDTSISKALGAARTLVEHFKRSELANTKLKEKQHQMNTLEGDTGVNSQTSPVPLPQKLISSRPNPTKKLGENPVPFHSRKNDSHSRVFFFFAEICQLQ